MLDPSWCLSIATAIAQFVDFGVLVLKAAREIQESKDTVKDVSNFEETVAQFERKCSDFRNSIASASRNAGTQPDESKSGLAQVAD